MYGLHPITAQFRDGRAEAEYRVSALPEVRHDSRVTLSVAAALTALFIGSDYNFLGLSWPFYPLLAVRLVVMASCIGLAVLLGRSDALLTRPWLYSVVPVVVATSVLFVTALRPQTLPTLMTSVVVLVMACYLFVPNLIGGMIASSAYLTLGFLAGAWYWAGAAPATVVAFGILLVLANFVGYVAARRLARLQRQQFALLREERRSKQRLLDEVARREALELRLRDMAQTDDLTGLSNRRHFIETAEAALAECRRHGRPLGLCMVDVDNFKAINDTHGHGCGDRVLRAIAAACSRVFGTDAAMGRFGGEEFVVALPMHGLDDARESAERLRREVSGLRFDGEIADLRVTVTVGVSEVGPVESELAAVLGRADAALYEGKRRGRDVVVVRGPEDGGRRTTDRASA